MTCLKYISKQSSVSFGNDDAFIMEKRTKLQKSTFCFQKCPRNIFWFVSFYISYFCAAALGAAGFQSVSMNTLTIMVNLWRCCSLPFCLLPLAHSSLTHSSHSLFLSAVASQDRAIVADRRRVGSINRYRTNYKADVPLYDGGRTLWEEEGLSPALSFYLLFYSSSPSLSLTTSFLGLCLALSFPDIF